MPKKKTVVCCDACGPLTDPQAGSTPLTALQAQAADRLSAFEDDLRRRLNTIPGTDSRLKEAMHYAVFNGGKRLRPLLTFASAEALQLDLTQAQAPACAVELIHCYSLVHDDLPAMDDDDLRRGRPTVHLAFDEATAILTGDALQALAYETLVLDPLLNQQPEAAARMVADLGRACGADGMAGGQALDLAMEGQRPNQAELEHMYALKTGALMRSAVTLPLAYRPELDAAVVEGLRTFGEHIGLAFQIRDDLLEVEGDTAQIGKSTDSDQRHDKATWPSLYGIDAAKTRINDLHGQAMAALNPALDALESDGNGLIWLADQLIHRHW